MSPRVFRAGSAVFALLSGMGSKLWVLPVYWFLFLLCSFLVITYPVFGMFFTFLILLFMIFVYVRSFKQLRTLSTLPDECFDEVCDRFGTRFSGFVKPTLVLSSAARFHLSALRFPSRFVFASNTFLSLSSVVKGPLYAHELAHLSTVKPFVLAQLSRVWPFFAFGFAVLSFLNVFSSFTVFVLFLVTFFVFKLLVLFLLRREEFLADKAAFELFGTSFTAALVSTAPKANTLVAYPFWWFWFSTHPSLASRLKKLNSYMASSSSSM